METAPLMELWWTGGGEVGVPDPTSIRADVSFVNRADLKLSSLTLALHTHTHTPSLLVCVCVAEKA